MASIISGLYGPVRDYPKTLCLKIIAMYCLHFWGSAGWVRRGLSGGCRQDAGGAASSEGSTGASESTSILTRWPLSPQTWAEGRLSVLRGQLATLRADAQERKGRGNLSAFRDLVSAVTHCHLCRILFIRSELQSPAHCQREEVRLCFGGRNIRGFAGLF